MNKEVLVLKIKNTVINHLFNDLRENYHELIPRFPHVTIRGPQKRFRQATLDKVEKITQDISMEITGLDILESNNVYFCVFIIKAPSLKEVWHKPDFPVQKFGFNPHITLCKGDKFIVNEIKERIECDRNFYNLIIDSKDIEIRKSVIGQRELSI